MIWWNFQVLSYLISPETQHSQKVKSGFALDTSFNVGILLLYLKSKEQGNVCHYNTVIFPNTVKIFYHIILKLFIECTYIFLPTTAIAKKFLSQYCQVLTGK